MKLLLAMLAIALSSFTTPAAAQVDPPAPAIAAGAIRSCPARAAVTADCKIVRLEDLGLSGQETLNLGGGETILVRPVTVAPAALPLSRPMMVWLTAMASSEIRWNGVVIGRNGVPGPDRAHERPGRFIASFVVPSRLVRPGENLVSARLSAHHLWLPVRSQVHAFEVGPYETPVLPGLRNYLPALLALGALAAAGIYFAAAAALDRRDRSALLLALIAGAAMLQLFAETARTFIAYTYPWHLARVMAIALLAAAAAVLIAAYAARRFAPDGQRRAVLAVGAAAVASVALIPWFDLKALAAILAGTITLLVCAVRGIRASLPGARIAAGAAVAVLGLMLYQLTDFLDQAYYLALAALLVALVAEQVSILRQARKSGEAESMRADGLEDRLRETDRASANTTVLLKDGARVHRVSEADILFARAADDYCEVRLRDGRTLLVTTTLARLHATLPDRFVRVHKSYVVNARFIASVSPRPGGGRMLALAGGAQVPVGRSYGGAIAPSLTSASGG